MNQELLEKLSIAVESGKINKVSPFPPVMRGMDGADELTKQALDSGISAAQVLAALVTGMGVIGISALLTTTMANMEILVKEIKVKYPKTAIIVGGAPLTQEFSDKIGASVYSPSPQGAVKFLNQLVA